MSQQITGYGGHLYWQSGTKKLIEDIKHLLQIKIYQNQFSRFWEETQNSDKGWTDKNNAWYNDALKSSLQVH